MTQRTSCSYFTSFKKIQMQAAKMDPLLSSLIQWASLKSFEARNKAEEQTNSTSYQALSGHFFGKVSTLTRSSEIKWFHVWNRNTLPVKDSQNPSNVCNSTSPLSLGLYVYNFVYFSKDPKVEQLFKHLLHQQIKVEFMGLTEWFLGIHFSWCFTSSDVTVHLNHSGYAANLVKQFSWDSWDPTPTATPYCSGFPINWIAHSTNDNSSPAQLRQTEAYQSLIGSIGWLATATCPDLSMVHSFLSSYNGKPSSSHMHAALYALHYIHLTHDHGTSFSSTTTAPIHSYLHFPDSADVKAYSNPKPPSFVHCTPLTTYSNACWGSKIGSAVHDGTLLPLFKFCSMSGGIIFCQGGPIAWMSMGQEKTSLSSCEVEIRDTN